MPDSDFAGSAQKLARNPLGIVALFLVLVYSIAGLVFGVAAKNLTPYERWPLILFLVIFPCLVLILFGWLVGWHHTKLYAPTDYQNPEGFFKAMTPREQRAKLDAELEKLQASIEVTTVADESRDSALEQSVAEKESTEVESRRQETITFIRDRSLGLRQDYLLAEELVFRELEAEFGRSVTRHVRVADGLEVDGILDRTPIPIAVEVKYLRPTMHWKNSIRETVSRLERLMSGSKAQRWSFLFAVVVDGFSSEQRSRISEFAERTVSSKVPGEVRVYDFGELKFKFGAIG